MFLNLSTEIILRIIHILVFYCIILIFSTIWAIRKKKTSIAVAFIISFAISAFVICSGMGTFLYKEELERKTFPICDTCNKQYYAGHTACPYCGEPQT